MKLLLKNYLILLNKFYNGMQIWPITMLHVQQATPGMSKSEGYSFKM